MPTPKEIIRSYSIAPKKKLGQSFLTDQNIIMKIAQAAPVTKADTVVEIGAGIGVLTEELAKKAQMVIAVEVDKTLVELLKDKLLKYNNIQIYSGDILKFDFSSIKEGRSGKIVVVGNVPYNISSPVIFHLLAFRKHIDSFLLMLQKEVVERLVAPPGTKTYGIPSVILQMFASLEKIFDVDAQCFYPVPQVKSAVLKGFFLRQPGINLADERFFVRLVRDAFAQRRKMLINNLKAAKLLSGISEEKIISTLETAGIDGRRRAETLTLEEFGNLSILFFQENQRSESGK